MYILSLATAVPEHFLPQEEFGKMLATILKPSPLVEQKMHKIFRNSRIDKRHAVIAEGAALRKLLAEGNPGMTSRNALYKEHAPALAKEAAEKALEKWGGKRDEITHVISVSCTGVLAPGIEFLLADQLGFNRSVERLGINFMGCFGAFTALRTASAIAAQNPKARILIVCTELCSLHFQLNEEMDTLVGNALFADGSAAVIVGGDPRESENPLWEYVQSASHAMDSSLNYMTWEGSDNGYVMRLSEQIPVEVHAHIKEFAERLVDDRAPLEECAYTLHPGGKAILFSAAKACKLPHAKFDSSYEVLREYGNMSSPTALFVLDHLTQQKPTEEWCVGVGFGPGLSLEGWLLRNATH